jgi:hypothetical protein
MAIQIQSFELLRILNPLKFLITSFKHTLKVFLWEFGGKMRGVSRIKEWVKGKIMMNSLFTMRFYFSSLNLICANSRGGI